jgi:UDP:flavonoid glycosyltransferase YjiC (YdhE family)
MFTTPFEGKAERLRPLIADLDRRGFEVHVFTDRRFATRVRQTGGRFVDLFGPYPVEAVDDESIPFPCRHVTFAAAYAERIAAELERLNPSLIVYDSFAVIARVLGRMLGIPYVAVWAGHNVNPMRAAPIAEDLPVFISPACHRAVATLRDKFGLDDASPYSYRTGPSPFLNLYGEPPEFLTPQERRTFEPVAFYGSLPPAEEIEQKLRFPRRRQFDRPASDPKIYVSFGAFSWRYWPREVFAALASISGALAELPDVSALLSLGGAELGRDAARRLAKPNVSVAPYVDQWEVLVEADLFVTHHGLKSTHESIFNRVPMVSYPLFADQPELAARCQRLGLAIPLADSPRAPLTHGRVHAAVTDFARRKKSMRARICEARDWELRVLAERDAVIGRIADLAED